MVPPVTVTGECDFQLLHGLQDSPDLNVLFFLLGP